MKLLIQLDWCGGSWENGCELDGTGSISDKGARIFVYPMFTTPFSHNLLYSMQTGAKWPKLEAGNSILSSVVWVESSVMPSYWMPRVTCEVLALTQDEALQVLLWPTVRPQRALYPYWKKEKRREGVGKPWQTYESVEYTDGQTGRWWCRNILCLKTAPMARMQTAQFELWMSQKEMEAGI
jgi:hypothetical protein